MRHEEEVPRVSLQKIMFCTTTDHIVFYRYAGFVIKNQFFDG